MFIEYGTQLNNIGNQLHNLGTEIQNMGIQNKNLYSQQIWNIGNELFSFGTKIIDYGNLLANIINNINNMNMNIQMFNMFNQMKMMNKMNAMNNLENKINEVRSNNVIYRICFQFNNGKQKLKNVDSETTVEHLLNNFINENNLNDKVIDFIFNASKLNLKDKTKIKDSPITNGSIIKVYEYNEFLA